jgi:transposase
MTGKILQAFAVNEPVNLWKDELFEFLNVGLEEIAEQSPMEKFEDITGPIFRNKSEILGQLVLGLIKKKHHHLLNQEYCNCPKCGKKLKAWNKKAKRMIESLGGSVELCRPYFYCKACSHGFYALDEALGLAPSPKQYDIQNLEAWLSSELPFKTAAEAFKRRTADSLSPDPMFQTANGIGNLLDILDVCPSKEEIEQKIDELSEGKFRRPVMMMVIDGAHTPTRPEPSPWKGKRGEGEYKEVKGFRLYLIDKERIVHLVSWHQIQDDEEFAQGLLKIREAGLIPQDRVRLCIIGDGAPWTWNKPLEIFPNAKQVLDFYHCSEYLHAAATAQYGKNTAQARQWVEATFTRLFHNNIEDVIR